MFQLYNPAPFLTPSFCRGLSRAVQNNDIRGLQALNMLPTKADLWRDSNLRGYPQMPPEVPESLLPFLSTPIRKPWLEFGGSPTVPQKVILPACVSLMPRWPCHSGEFPKDLRENVVDKSDFFLAELHNAELLYRKIRVLIKHAKSCHKFEQLI